MTSSLVELWRTLRADRPVGVDQVRSEPLLLEGQSTGVSLAVDSAGDLHLLAPVDTPPGRPLPPDVNGLRLREGRLGDQLCLDLCSPAAHERMFATLCEELVEAVLVQRREPWSAASAIVLRWQSAFRPLRQPMSRSVQIGAIGELILLQSLWLPVVGTDAVHYWSGPDRERHDFVTPHLHLEVKATTTGRHEHEISRVDQLRAPEGRRLLLASVQLEESAMGAVSVATLVDDVVAAVRHDPAALDAFLSRMDGLGWSDEMRRSRDLVRCHLREAQVFDVDEDFPGLPADFALPRGVVAIRYTISLANLPFLDALEVRAAVLDATRP